MGLDNSVSGNSHLRTVNHRITTAVPTVSPQITVREAIKFISANIDKFATINYLYVISKRKKLKGTVSIKELFAAQKDQKVEDIMKVDLAVVHRRSRQETAVLLALKHNIKAVPVVDRDNRFLGVITSDSLLDILNQEATEDILHFSGTYLKDRNLTNLSPLRLALARLPWIGVGMLAGIVAGMVVSLFSQTIRTALVLSVFIPLIMSTSGNIGSQSAVIFVRSLTLRQLPILPYLLKEIQVGAIIGTLVSIFIFFVSLIWFSSLAISFSVALALFLNSLLVVTVGLGIPWLLYRLKLDPAVGTAPFVTSIVDILSLFVYLSLATVVVFIFF